MKNRTKLNKLGRRQFLGGLAGLSLVSQCSRNGKESSRGLLRAATPPSQEGPSAAGPPVSDIGLHKQLLVDDYVIAEKYAVTRELGQPSKRGAVLEPSLPTDYHPSQRGPDPGHPVVYDKADGGYSSQRKPGGTPVAVDFGYFITVLQNQNGKYQLWYMAWRNDGVGYAESKDGIQWTKPLVGMTGKDNIVHRSQGFSCMIDPTVPWGSAEKYKAAFDSLLDKKGDGTNISECGLAHSPDGIHWTDYNQGRSVTHRASDFHNQILWDPIRKKYRLMTRTDMGTPGGGTEWRSVRVMYHRSNDLLNDPAAWEILMDKIVVEDPLKEMNSWGVPRLQFNAMTCWIYEGVYFGLMDVYTMDRPTFFEGWDYQTRHNEDYMNLYLGTSRDGLNFDKSWIHNRRPFIPRGPAGSFDKDAIKPPSQILTIGDEHCIYYAGMDERHFARGRDLKIALAKLRLDGFVCLEARGQLGTVKTKPFKLGGRSLQVNTDARGGRMFVEVLDDQGKPIPGFSAAAAKNFDDIDDLRLRPEWKDRRDLSELQGRVVSLKFYLWNAKLYSFQIQADA